MTYRTKLIFLTLIPLLLITLATLLVIETRSKQLVADQRTTIDAVILEEKKRELRNYLSLAEKAIEPSYNSFLKTKRQAQQEAMEILREMSANEDQYFFVFDGTGTAIVEPRLSFMQDKNWYGLVNVDGIPVIRNLIVGAKSNTDFYTFVWQKPSTKEYVPKMTHSKYFERWDWVLGTGIYLDDVEQDVGVISAQMVDGFSNTKRQIAWLAVTALAATAIVMGLFQLRQQRLADAELRRLNRRLVDIQEDNRKRISQELHDGISQLLVSSRYGLEAALGETTQRSKVFKPINASIRAMDSAIAEIRRISMFLRPTVLDDIGLAAAVRALGSDFESDLGIPTSVTTMPVGNMLPDDAKTAMYRIVQEALTNITKYAQASSVTIDLTTTRSNVRLSVKDDGIGFDAKKVSKGLGLGLRNMHERIDSFGGTIHIRSKPNQGTSIRVALPVQKS